MDAVFVKNLIQHFRTLDMVTPSGRKVIQAEERERKIKTTLIVDT